MKRIRPMIGGLLVGCIALAMVTTASAQVQPGSAKVVSIKGNARYFVAGSTVPQPLKVGSIIKAGSVIQTAGNSHVDVVLNNPNAPETALGSSAMTEVVNYKPKVEQDSIRIMENSVLGIDKLSIDQTGAETATDTQLDLKAGKIFGTVKKLNAASKYQIKIPNGVAGIRGTIYFLSAEGVLSVISGSVVLSFVGPDGSLTTQVVSAGQQYDARTGQITTIPEGLYQEMIQLSQGMSTGPSMPPVAYTIDATVYFVSPVQSTASVP